MGAVTVGCAVSQCACCIYCTFLTPNSLATDVADAWNRGGLFLTGYSQMNEMLAIAHLLRREMRFRLFTPIILPLMSLPWSTCRDGTPWWTYVLLIPIVCRAKYFEYWILKRLASNPGSAMLSFGFVL